MQTVHAAVIALAVMAASCSSDNRPYTPKSGTTYDKATGLPNEIISSKDGAEMVLVVAGSMKPGDPDRMAKRVSVRAFYIDRHEVTNDRYHLFVDATNQPTHGGNGAGAMLGWVDGVPPQGRGSCPVVLVSFSDAKAFATWAGKKLPTQTQWEYAARGSESFAYPWGDTKLQPAECNTSDRLAGKELLSSAMWQHWYDAWSKRDVAVRNVEAVRPVGSFPKDVSPFGALDMGGGVREWCTKRQSQELEASGELTLTTEAHVTCGGSWFRDMASAEAWLYESPADSPYYDVGFRCVVSASDPDIQALAKAAK